MSQDLKKKKQDTVQPEQTVRPAPSERRKSRAAISDWEEAAPAKRAAASSVEGFFARCRQTRRKVRHIQRRWRHIVREVRKHNFPESERAPILLVLFAWNMLPIYPLDGGRALRLLLRENCTWAEWLLLLPAAFLLGLLLHRLGLPFWWASLTIPEKLLANFRKSGYNRGNTEMR